LLFFWPKLLRQIRVTGHVVPIDPAEVRASFQALPAEVQAMIRACRQSEPIADRATLERIWADALAEAPPGGGAMPEDWGGYRVQPESIEFWQARAHRLQDRLRLTRTEQGAWRVERLIP
jgi:pyridoxamine 5'-phosphate oxidase